MTIKTSKHLRPPPEVKCAKKGKCRGANHDPSCPVYIWALENWEIPKTEKKPRQRERGYHPAPGEARLSDEQKAAISAANGAKGGRPRAEVPYALLEILKKGKFRVREEYKKGDEVGEAAAALAGWSMERLAHVAAGRVHTRKAPSMAKAAAQIREEICEPIEKAILHKGGVDLGRALDSVDAAPARPSDEEPAPPEKGEIQ